MDIVTDFEPNEEDIQFVLDGLIEFNDSNFEHIKIKKLGVFLKDDDRNIVDGIQPICFEK